MAITRLKRKHRKNIARANNKQRVIKQLLSTPVIKNVDIEELKAQFGTSAAEVVSNVKEKVSKVAAAVADKVEDVVEAVKDKVAEVTESKEEKAAAPTEEKAAE